MSCRSMVSLLRRCASARRATLSAGNITASRSSVLSGRCGFIQQRTPTRTDCLRGLSQLQSALWSRRSGFCTKAGESFDSEYPPLPDYHIEPEPEPEPESAKEKEDVYIVQAKGLPWTCTADDVLHFFSDCRIRDGVEGIYLAVNNMGMPRGSAFIELENEEDVSKALQKNRHFLGSRYVEVREVTQTDAESILKSVVQCPADSYLVRIRGVPFYSTEDDIVNFFSGLDIVEGGISLQKDNRGRNSGIAFVQFSSQEAATEALQRHNRHMGDRYIEVFPQTFDFRQMSTVNIQPVATQTYPRTATTADTESIWNKADSWVVQFRGPPPFSESNIVEFFSGLDIVEKVLTIVTDQKGRISGMAYVQFSSPEAANEALQRQRQLTGDGYIEMFPSTSDRIPSTKEMKPQPLSRRPVPNTLTNTRTAAQVTSFGPSGHTRSASQPTHFVHMSGLPYEVSKNELKEFFYPIAVSKIVMEYVHDKRPNGHADVYFNNHKDAMAAMSRDKHNIGERYIKLFLNSEPDSA